MLIKENQLLQKFKEQNINYVPLLLYGSNEGLIRENYTKLKNIFNQTNFEEINLVW
jgi:DNA polymerase III delta subunit